MTTKQLNTIIEQGEALKLISQAYTEIASAKLKKIRDQVEKNRYYMDDLSRVYQAVKQVAARRNLLPLRNKKTMNILITSNYHFYGNVNTNLTKFFIASMNSYPGMDQIVIGKTGLEYLEGGRYPQRYQALILKTDYPKLDELNFLVSKIKDYSQIVVYYSKLESVLVQKPSFEDITQTSALKGLSATPDKEDSLYIFEPEIEKILDFFESQVTNLLLQQTFLDSELSRTASRLVSMDEAQSNADKYILDQKKVLASVKRSIANSKILETYTALRKKAIV